MIIIEFLWKCSAWLLFKLIRFFIWLFAARDCRHCKHCYRNPYNNKYCCNKGNGTLIKCQLHPLYADFERKSMPKGFFDIL